MDAYQTETLDAFRNLTAATEQDRAVIANLTTTNTQLNSDIQSLKTAMQLLTIQLTAMQTTTTPRTETRTRTPRGNDRDESYCWSHGRTRNPEHTSTNCRNKKTGHQATATLANKLGGNTRYCKEIGTT